MNPRSIRPAQSRAINGRGQQKNTHWAMFALVGFAVLALIGGLVWFVAFRTSGEPQTIALSPMTRDALAPAPKVEVEKIFTDEVVRRLNNGDSLTQELATTFRGQEEWKKTFHIPAQKMSASSFRPKRRQEVADKIEEYKKLLAEFAAYQPRTWSIELYVDDTDGINQKLSEQVHDEFSRLGVDQMLTRGDTVKVTAYRLSDSFFVNSKEQTLTGSVPATIAPIEWVLEKRAGKPASSLSSGLFNALAQNTNTPNRVVLVFSDGLENSTTADFYKNPPKKEQYSEVITKLTGQRPVPNLKGVDVAWHCPKTAAHSAEIDSSKNFWEAVLRQAGAWNVKIVY